MKALAWLLFAVGFLAIASAADDKLGKLHRDYAAATTDDDRIAAAIKIWDYLDGELTKITQRIFETLEDDATKKRFVQAHADWKNFRMSAVLFESTAYRDDGTKRLMHILAYIRITERYMAELLEYQAAKSGAKKPNKALEPTPKAVTSPAAQEPRQP